MSAHTQGPWAYEETSGYVRCADGSAVADAYEALEKAQSDINGRLIAAAPDLLDALQDVMTEYAALLRSDYSTTSNPHPEHKDQAIAVARKAIAKATGVQS